MDIFRRMPLVEWQVASGRVCVTPPMGGPHDLIGGAAMVWAVLDRPRSLRGIMAELRDLDPGLDEGQVLGIISQLIGQHLVAKDEEAKIRERAV